jgi:hypothetical protein
MGRVSFPVICLVCLVSRRVARGYIHPKVFFSHCVLLTISQERTDESSSGLRRWIAEELALGPNLFATANFADFREIFAKNRENRHFLTLYIARLPRYKS